MLKRKPISIVILFHNGASYLQACLHSLLNTVKSTDEIIVVVNNENRTVHDININKDRVNYLHFYENLGHGKAANKGIQLAKNEYIVITDHDIVFNKGWLDELWKFYHSDDKLGAVSCKIINTLNNKILDYGIAFSDFNFCHPFMDLHAAHPLTCVDRQTQMICTGGFLTQKSILETVSGFEENYGSLYTDLDICLKLNKANFKVGVSSKAVAYHFSGDLLKISRKYKSSFLKSDVKGAFMRKNADILETDLQNYYKFSAEYFNNNIGHFKKYFICNLMNVVNPVWYEEVLLSLGITRYDRIECATGERDAENIRLFETLGYDIMMLGVPIAYFVDRFSSLINNAFWWQERKVSSKDIIIDRNANIIAATDIIY